MNSEQLVQTITRRDNSKMFRNKRNFRCRRSKCIQRDRARVLHDASQPEMDGLPFSSCQRIIWRGQIYRRHPCNSYIIYAVFAWHSRTRRELCEDIRLRYVAFAMIALHGDSDNFPKCNNMLYLHFVNWN